MMQENRLGNPLPFRKSLRAKLMMAFGMVSLIGYVAALQVLPRLYVYSQIRDIENAHPINAKALRYYFVSIVNSPEEASQLRETAQSAAHSLCNNKAFLRAGLQGTESLTPQEVIAHIKEPSDSQSMIELRRIFMDLVDEFLMVRVIPWRVPNLLDRISFMPDGSSPRLFIPILVPLLIPDTGEEWTLAVGNPADKDPMVYNGREIREIMGLKSATNVLFYSPNELKDQKPALWNLVLANRERDFWPAEFKEESLEQRFLFIPADNLDQLGSLAGVFCIVYLQPSSGLFPWKELASSGLAYWALAIAAMAAFLFSYFFARRISRPIQNLTMTAVAISQGHLDRRVAVKVHDEIGVLARTFNEMTDRLRTTLEELRDRAETIEKQNIELDLRFKELNALQNYTENVLATVDSAILSVDLDGKIRSQNRAAHSLLGLVEGQVLEDLASETIQEKLRSSLDLGETTVSDETTVISPRGEKVTVALSVSPLREGDSITGAVAVLTDLQVIKNLEAIVSRQERLAALGQLTAGVAHELRNPLSIIKACAEILNQRFASQPGEQGLTSDIIEEVDRLSRVVTEFLTFARPNQPNRSRVHLNELLARNIALVERGEGDSVTFIRSFEEPLPDVEADAEQIAQVVLNLVRNGIEAMNGSKVIEIRTGQNIEDRTVWFEVADHGEGMDEETRRKIFDPFYTTKTGGTGLGLSICHRIIESHGGTIQVVKSEPGKGTVFRVVFPLLEGSPNADNC